MEGGLELPQDDSIASSNQAVRPGVWQILPVSAILSIRASLPADNSRGISKLRLFGTALEDRHDGSLALCADPGRARVLRGLLLHADVRRSLRRTGL
jgi:hypothetical protein